jgi:uncharacterized protein with HEPN domain
VFAQKPFGTRSVPSSKPQQRLQDIVDNVEKIARYTAHLTEAEFQNQDIVVDAVERCLMRISEAAIKIGSDADRLCPGLPWADIRGIGNKLRHLYDDVDADIVWNLISTNKLDALKSACLAAIAQLDGDATA